MKIKYFLYSSALCLNLIALHSAENNDAGWSAYLTNTEVPILVPLEHPYLQAQDPHAPSAVVIEGHIIPLDESTTDFFISPAPATPPQLPPLRPSVSSHSKPSLPPSPALSLSGRKMFLPGEDTEQNYGGQFFVLPAAPVGGKYIITFEQSNPVVEVTQTISSKPSLLRRVWNSIRGRNYHN